MSTSATRRPTVPPRERRLAWALGERVKELRCLYAIARLAERRPASLAELFERAVAVLPPAWQYPEIACAEVVFRGSTFRTEPFARTRWRQSAPLLVAGTPCGEVTVCYTEARPGADEGPFLAEERALITAVAEHLGLHIERFEAEAELADSHRLLTVEREALRESNAALRGVLARIEDEKKEVCRNIQANVEKVLLPVLNGLAQDAGRGQRRYIELLRGNLLEIASPFINRVASRWQALTPTELHICNMIRGGMRTKEIAHVRHVSSATINRHREHIRRKLGIANRPVNLVTFLQAESAP